MGARHQDWGEWRRERIDVESRALAGEVGGLGPFAGVDLLAVGGLHARDLEAAVGADHGEAVGLDRDDLAHLAGDALGVLRRQRLGVEDLQLLAVERRPGAGRRIAAADQPVDLLATACPSRCGRCRGRSGLRRWPSTSSCLMRGALPAFTRSTDFQHRLDAHREQAVEIDGAERVGGADRRLLLEQHVAGIEAVVGPEDRQAGFLLALDDRPVDRAGAAIGRQQRGVILDRAVGRDVEEFLRHEQRDERHHLQVGLERLELLPHFRLAVGRRLIDRQLGGERRFLQRIGLRALLLRRDIDGDDVLAALDAAPPARPCRRPAGREPRYAFDIPLPELSAVLARGGGTAIPTCRCSGPDSGHRPGSRRGR